jgi:hypothetical protein
VIRIKGKAIERETTMTELEAKRFLEAAACEFHEAVVAAGRLHVGSDDFEFTCEVVFRCAPADREKGARVSEDIQQALDRASVLAKAQAQAH